MILEYSFEPKYEISKLITLDELIERLQEYVHHFKALKKLKNVKLITDEVGYFVWRIETDDPVEIKKAAENCFIEVDEDGIPIEEKVANKVRADLRNETLPKAFEWDHPTRGNYYIPKGEWAPKLKLKKE